jgi:hypothetical protein
MDSSREEAMEKLRQAAHRMATAGSELPEPIRKLGEKLTYEIEAERMKGWVWRFKTMEALIDIARGKPDPEGFVRQFFEMGLGDLVPVTEAELRLQVEKRGRPWPK